MNFEIYSVPKLSRSSFFNYLQETGTRSVSSNVNGYYNSSAFGSSSSGSSFRYIAEDSLGPTLSGFTRTGNIESSGSITALGSITGSSLNVSNQAVIGGMLDIGGTSTFHKDSSFDANLKVGKDLNVLNDAQVGNILTANYGNVNNWLKVGTDLEVSNNAKIGLDLKVGRNLSANRFTSGGSLFTPGFLYVGEDTYLDGDVDIREKLKIGGETTTSGGITSSDFVHDINTGSGWQISKDGDAEFNSLIIREFLEVPELRYNRCTVESGTIWNAPGAGLIYDVDTKNQIIYLKLEKGEVGTFQAGDICMGVWHYLDDNKQYNASESDENNDRDGLSVAGFSKVYFEVTDVDDYSINGQPYLAGALHYITRKQYADTNNIESDKDDKFNLHPMTGMTIVGYGSFTNTNRQKSAYATRTFKRYLIGVNNWDIQESNIAMQVGDCSKLVINGMSMSGYSAYMKNIYMTGTIKQIKDDGSEDGVKDGKSAYELWLEAGNTGTLEDFLNSLKGTSSNGESAASYSSDKNIITIPCTYQGKAKQANTINVKFDIYDGSDVVAYNKLSNNRSLVFNDSSKYELNGVTVKLTHSDANYIQISNVANAEINENFSISITFSFVSDKDNKTKTQTISIGIYAPRADKSVIAITQLWYDNATDAQPTEAQKAAAVTTRPEWINGYLYTGYKFLYEDNSVSYSSNWTKSSLGTSNTALRPRGIYSASATYVYNDNYRDYVMIPNPSLSTGYEFFVIKKYGTSITGKSPKAEGDTYWSPFSEFEAIATNVLLANQGYINVLGSASIFVGTMKADGTTRDNGWVLSESSIRHTSSGLELTSDGKLKMPSTGSLSFSVGDGEEKDLTTLLSENQSGGGDVTKEQLKATGIDIDSKSITMTSGKFTVQKNDGTKVFYTDETDNDLHVVGTITANKGSFTGTINAQSGKIGGFSIVGSGITNETSSTAGSQASPYDYYQPDAYFIIRNDKMGATTAFGANVLPSSTALRCNALIENTYGKGATGYDTNYFPNTALLLNCEGSKGFYNASNTNYSILAQHGVELVFDDSFTGIRPYIYSAKDKDNVMPFHSKVLLNCNDKNYIVFYLPTLAQVQEALWIGKNTAFAVEMQTVVINSVKNFYIYGKNKNSGATVPYLHNGDPGTVDRVEVAKGDAWKFLLYYDGSGSDNSSAEHYSAYVISKYN